MSIRTLREVMSPRVVTLSPEMTLRRSAERFAKERISGAPVISAHRVLGVLSVTDLLEWVAKKKSDGTERTSLDYYTRFWATPSAETYARAFATWERAAGSFYGHTVADVMTRVVFSMPPEAELFEAADYMLKRAINRLLVVDEGRLVGVVTTTDLVRALGRVRRRHRRGGPRQSS